MSCSNKHVSTCRESSALFWILGIMEGQLRSWPSWSVQSTRGDRQYTINVVSKFCNSLDNKCFAKAEGQVATWSKSSSTSLHEKERFQQRGESRLCKEISGEELSNERGQSTVLRWEEAGESKLPLLSLDFVFHPCFLAQNRGIVHVYWVT